jgi:hypothetical protein
MNQISQKDVQIYQQWRGLLEKQEIKNREMNLRFLFLKKSIAAGNFSRNLDQLTSDIQFINLGISRSLRAAENLESGKFFFQPKGADFDIMGEMGSEAEFSGFGAIPLLAVAGVALVAIVVGAIASMKTAELLQNKAIQDIKMEQLKTEQQFAAASPAVQQKWMDFKKAEAPLMAEINKLANASGGGFFDGLLESGKSLLLFGLAAVVLVNLIQNRSKN